MVEPNTLAGVTRAAVRLARTRTTPFYLFDAGLASATARRWRRIADRSGILEVCYPYKCNRHPGLLDALAREGLGAEVASRADLDAAISRGIAGLQLILQGPAKEPALLERALRAGARIVADGPEDAAALLQRSEALNLAPRYLLRFRASSAEPSQRQFGFRPAELLTWARRALARGNPAPEGLAFHLGTGIASGKPYAAAIREAAAMARELRAVGVIIRILDAGGGFAAAGESRRDRSGRPRPEPPPPEEVLGGIAAEIRKRIPEARALVEPGRALASDAFTLVTRVRLVRANRVYVDASRMSHALFVPHGKHRFLPVPFRSGGRRREVVGPLPVDLDRLSRAESIGRPREGDLILIGSVGAYNVIAANAWAGDLPEVVEKR